jgi:phosphatidylserine/phosphatidylglycerophosphate/cardiolipin synthase-like enzyme
MIPELINNKHNTNYSLFSLRKKENNIVFLGDKVNYQSKLPVENKPLPKDQKPVNITVSYDLGKKLIDYSNKVGLTVNDYILTYMKHLAPRQGVLPEPSVTANIGKTKVTTLIDAEQIFDKTVDFIKSAQKTIQIEMFEFQNLNIDGDIWPSKGAEIVPGWEQQQKILQTLIEKKKANPNLNIQIILDVHKWYTDGNGNKERNYEHTPPELVQKALVKQRDKYRRYANMKMIRYLKENGIDVVPYPRSIQQGSGLQHVKLLAIDSKKVIIGGMNWGNHSAANHDVCVAIEPGKNKNGNEYAHTEVDNIIEEIFNKDWKFAWQRLGATKIIQGPLSEEEQKDYNLSKKKILPENIEYMEIVGKIFDKPEYKERYKNGNLNLPEIKPVENPEIRVLTNKPRELGLIGEDGSEAIGKYIRERLDTATHLRAELFALTHKEITNKIINRHKEAQNGGRPFDVQILISPDIIEEFPYCRKAFEELQEAGVPIRTYNVFEPIEQRLHCKLAIFDKKDVIIGSANWSAVGLEQNLGKGLRPDYPLTDIEIDKTIQEKKPAIKKLEDILGISSIFINGSGDYNYKEMLKRKNIIKTELRKTENALKKCELAPDFIEFEDYKINSDEKNIQTLKKLAGYYRLVQYLEGRREKYKRGNNEATIVFSSPKIAATFIKQFNKDWKYSDPDNITDPIKAREYEYGIIAFTGSKKSNSQSFNTMTEPRFDRTV